MKNPVSRILSTLIFIMMSSNLFSQVTFRIIRLPENTDNSDIFLASGLNGWNPADAQFKFKKDLEGNYSLTIPKPGKKAEYKITKGSWDSVETDENGNATANRIYDPAISELTVPIEIKSWNIPKEKKHTANSHVRILSEHFKIPQLNSTRKIWIYLPPDYQTSGKKYPVIYMQDGQNLFDDYTSFSGEWQVDETLDAIYNETGRSAIVIGIDNGGDQRLAEYSPWNNAKYKTTGQGNLYADFLAKTLKPFIDKTYRTQRQTSKTIILGSSIGGLISLYTAVKYPETFGKAGIFSPAFWFVSKDLKNYLNRNRKNLRHSEFYFVAGKDEDETMVPEIEATQSELINNSVDPKNIIVKIDQDGTHSETYWKRELKQALMWLLK
ncbi:alpha/beta hydrolase-fold protein [Epilithonimonas sp.]|uniref:alpha/beta hydrolase-fold protein n=1 Tax=Epilithonimonas sp. TaxID=2894511 RepID=UPI0035AE515C